MCIVFFIFFSTDFLSEINVDDDDEYKQQWHSNGTAVYSLHFLVQAVA